MLIQINGESDLHECKINEACNVIHNRFWVSSLTERMCRCPKGKECPWQWTKELRNSSLPLNNKSHMEVHKEYRSYKSNLPIKYYLFTVLRPGNRDRCMHV